MFIFAKWIAVFVSTTALIAPRTRKIMLGAKN
jgi:hypothetical protein